ncbi:DHA1 family inner membrane transport protein [Paenibacillus sp. SORGH_AS306]|uniref:MFS transporter n=1 Tax=unclassified Paenibacillus TaxID=185978 RepID=UPI0027875662|nr:MULTISPECIES: MFS transporter [unclassified Paenibacillus]MDQ1234176.1 DHA1 family inner membrane transport protein [Paenibacillus sp. SORGH_AS_0306]MDR6111220.1 DHA1 family inner membrane transport protein [Paenibacillus sp. SORGH_AS_0338]
MNKGNRLLLIILTIGVFGIINTEMGVIGILPSIAEHFNVSVTKAGLLVSLFALIVAISGPTMPLLFSAINRKYVMLLVLGVFVISNTMSLLTTDFTVLLIARILPAFFHPIYCSLAFTVAASSVSEQEMPKAVSKVFIGVSAGMVAGVPIVSLINTVFSLQMAMAFFVVINAIIFVATLFFIPSMPVVKKLSYRKQLSVMAKPVLWISIMAVIFLNASIFGVYSYFADYLITVTHMAPSLISATLFIFGGANIIGNIVSGRLLISRTTQTIFGFPLLLGVVYLIMFVAGQSTLAIMMITLVWGILVGGMMANINQYLIATTAPEAPDFANGLFISACNLGTTIGAAGGGLLLAGFNTSYIVFVGILSLIISLVVLLFRNAISKNDKLTAVSL